jgi:hypothetical protein
VDIGQKRAEVTHTITSLDREVESAAFRLEMSVNWTPFKASPTLLRRHSWDGASQCAARRCGTESFARSCYEAPPRGVTRGSPSCRDFLDTVKCLYKRKTEDEQSEFLR